MKSLRDYEIKLGEIRPGEGTLTWGPAFTPPIHAIVNGLPVRVLNTANQPGASPVYNCVDATGFSTLVKFADVTILDGAYLPLTEGTTSPLTTGTTSGQTLREHSVR